MEPALAFLENFGFDTGDIMILVGTAPGNLEVGNVVVFFNAIGEPIIHRIIEINDTGKTHVFHTKGDHNADSIRLPYLDESSVSQDMIIGKAVLRIPYLGWIKIWFFNLISYVGKFVAQAL